MAATTPGLIIKGFQIHSGSTANGIKEKLEMIVAHYDNIASFLSASQEDMAKLVFKVDRNNYKLTENEFAKIEAFQKSGLLDGGLSVQQNFIKVLATLFVQRQIDMIDNIKLETLNVNPILAGALNLSSETDLIRYYVYQAISRSIVTSVGFLVQDLLLYASDFVIEGRGDELGDATKWDLVIEKVDEVKAYLEVKSGTNDLNKAQIHHYLREFEVIESKGFRAFIGETYGKREDQTVTHGLYKMYLPEWEKRTLIGRELWTFVSGRDNYHLELVNILFDTSKGILANESFIKIIEEKIGPLVVDFKAKYKDYSEFLTSLW